MNKKLIKTIASITCGLGITSSIPFATTSCGTTVVIESPSKLEIRGDKVRDISGNVNRSLASFKLSDHVYTDLGKQVTSGLKFICDNLPSGLEIGEDDGVIRGTPLEETNVDVKIIVLGEVDGMKLWGETDLFNITIGEQIPTKLEIRGVSVSNIVGNIGISITKTPDLSNAIYTDTDQHITSGLVFSIAGGALPNGLKFNADTGVIEGDPEAVLEPAHTYTIQVRTLLGVHNLLGETEPFTIKIGPRIQEDLEIRKAVSDIVHNINFDFDASPDLSNYIYTTKTGQKITSDLHFSISDGYSLLNGLTINESTGVIDGQTTTEGECTCKIKVTTIYDGKQYTGETDEFVIYSTTGALPSNAYEINEWGSVRGWSDKFNNDTDLYKQCTTMKFPRNVKDVYQYAFQDCQVNSYIPDFITTLDLSSCTNLQEIGYDSFYKAPFTSIILPSSLNTIDSGAFYQCSSLTYIGWIGLNSEPTIHGQYTFQFQNSSTSKGTVKIIDGDGSYTSEQLVELLKQHGLPLGWVAC